jgi:hypothetical protein
MKLPSYKRCIMKTFILSLACSFISLVSLAQHIYQIRADSVRIFNICDTAELILENHTQHVRGFLYNRGGGRTEFKRLELISVGDSAIAIPGQDTLSLRAMLWSGAVSRGLVIAPDADYTIPDSVGVVLLRDVTAAGRKIILPDPKTNMNRQIVILDKTSGSNRWTVGGAYVPRDAKGKAPYAAQENIVLTKGEKLILFSDGEKWYDLNVCHAGFNKSPSVQAGADTTLPQGTTQTTLNAVITPGTSSYYTIIWRVISKPPGVTVSIPDSTKAGTNVTGLSGGSYVFTIIVTDANGLTAIDTIRITIVQPAQMFSSGGYNDNVYDSATGRKTWIYLPEGYDPQRAEKYPLLIYLVGAGHSGTDINVLLQDEPGLPKLLYNRAFPMECVVIFPQFTSGWWAAPEILKAYNWAVPNYNIDKDRVYLTGYSSGGSGSCEAVKSYPELFAAYMPVSSVNNLLQTSGPRAKDVAAYFLHDFLDPYVNTQISWDVINSINKTNPKGLYPPIMRMTRLGIHNFNYWNRQLYDKRVAPIDFEKDFLLMHNRQPIKTAANYVTRAENANDYVQYAIAKKLLDKLPASAEKTALEQRLNVKLQLLTASRRYFLIDLGHSANAPVPNTTKIISAAVGTVKHGLTDVLGNGYPISFEVAASNDPVPSNDGMDNDYLGMDHTTYKDGFNISGTGSRFLFTNLSSASRFTVRLFYSRRTPTGSANYDFKATANGVTMNSAEVGWNSLEYTDLGNITPDGDGKITLDLVPLFGNTAMVNAIMLIESPSTQPVLKAQFNFLRAPVNLPGWTDVYGDPTTQVREISNPATGWVISTVNTSYWVKYFDRYGSDTNGVYTGTFTDFPALVVKGYYLNYQTKFNGSNYSLEIKRSGGQGLPAGTYRVKLISSIRSVMLTVTESDAHVKFGNSPNQMKHVFPTDNANVSVVFTGQVQEGGTIKLGVYSSYKGWSDFGLINGLIIEKID